MKPLDIFGNTDSRKMPEHLFWGALYLDHSTAIRGNPDNQNYSVCPRHWYIDADFKCEGCAKEFTWTVREQKAWFEDYSFWIDSHPRHCKKCIASRRRLQTFREEYDSTVAIARNHGSVEQKRRIIEIINELEKSLGKLPIKMLDTKSLFQRQIDK